MNESEALTEHFVLQAMAERKGLLLCSGTSWRAFALDLHNLKCGLRHMRKQTSPNFQFLHELCLLSMKRDTSIALFHCRFMRRRLSNGQSRKQYLLKGARSHSNNSEKLTISYVFKTWAECKLQGLFKNDFVLVVKGRAINRKLSTKTSLVERTKLMKQNSNMSKVVSVFLTLMPKHAFRISLEVLVLTRQAAVQQTWFDTHPLRHELAAAVMLAELIRKKKKYKKEKSSTLPHYHFDT